MEPIITKHVGATYIDNDAQALKADRGGYSDNEYEQMLAAKNTQISELTLALQGATSALNGVKYNATISASHSTVIAKANGTDVTTALTTIGTGVARETELEVTVTADEGYEISSVSVNGASVTLTEGKFTLTLNGNKTITVSTSAVVESTPTE